MNDTSRRKFLAVAGAGAAATAAGVAVPAAAGAATRRAHAADQPVVAFVENPRASVVTLMFGDDEVIVEDRDLVVRILNAAGSTKGGR
jgi:hypothetical protein